MLLLACSVDPAAADVLRLHLEREVDEVDDRQRPACGWAVRVGRSDTAAPSASIEKGGTTDAITVEGPVRRRRLFT